MRALIDGDVCVYRCAWASQDETEGIAIARVEATLELIKGTLNTELYQVILSPTGKSNFRYKIDPNYHSHRKQEKPVHYEALREHLLEAHNATVAHGEEADDLLSILQMESLESDSTVIVTIDKDLDQCPGNHYNYVKGDIYYVSPIEGTRWFYKQMLQGDASDGIKGVRGIGPKGANKWLGEAVSDSEMFNIVQELYYSEFKENTRQRLQINGQLLWIRRKRDEIWQPPE